MKVYIPTPLLSYTGEREVEANGSTLDHLLDDLDRQYQGIRFRMIDEQDQIRPHIRIFVDNEQEYNIARALIGSEEVVIVQALSGG